MHIGYKKCQGGRIVKLEILGEHNEDRTDIVDKQFAKMRCSKAKVLKIHDFQDETKTFDTAYGLNDHSFVYRVGEIVEPTEAFDRDLDKVCTSGIHYFLTKEPACVWDYTLQTGVNEGWHDNGQIEYGETIKDGLCNGPCEEWYEDGQIKMRCTYTDGKKDGLCEVWNKDGSVNEEKTKVY